MKKRLAIIIACNAISILYQNTNVFAQETIGYQLPPKRIQTIVTAPQVADLMPDTDGKNVLIIEYVSSLNINELSRPTLMLAGIQIDSLSGGRVREDRVKKLSVKCLTNVSSPKEINLPNDAFISDVSWSPDNTKVAFCLHSENDIKLWYIEITDMVLREVPGIKINDIFEHPYEWMPDSKRILCRTIHNSKKHLPDSVHLIGPIIQSSKGIISASRTHQGTLRNNHDEYLFESYGTSQVVIVGLEGRYRQVIGTPGIVSYSMPSPNGKYVLLETIHKPYSYSQKYYRFPRKVDIFTTRDKYVKTLVEIPLLENIAPSRDAASHAARGHDWRTDDPATVYWIEAKDKGDPKNEQTIRDEVFMLKAPFKKRPTLVHKCSLRFNSISWGSNSVALVKERWWQDRKYALHIINPKKGHTASRRLMEYSANDLYAHPGEVVTRRSKYGTSVIDVTEGSKIYLKGRGVSPQGERPFVDQLDLTNGQLERIWQSSFDHHEQPIALFHKRKNEILIKKESINMNPNYFLHDLNNGVSHQITHFENPYTDLNIERKEFRFTRKDGLTMSAFAFLPKEHIDSSSSALPTLLWAYPVDYKESESAGQVVSSPNMFSYFPPFTPLALAARGFAVIFPMMPVVGEGKDHPNDTYLEQIIMNAEAAIAKGDSMGFVDTARIAIGGHSYGAFMAANLATHTKLFKAAITISGAYNRTLTPFGFQSEERSYWQAPSMYNSISPFQNADRMKTPLLLVHGAVDVNSGTFPLQSRRYYEALKGLGTTVRYISMPYEGHNFQAEESVMHIYWEMIRWLDKHLNKSSQTNTRAYIKN